VARPSTATLNPRLVIQAMMRGTGVLAGCAPQSGLGPRLKPSGTTVGAEDNGGGPW